MSLESGAIRLSKESRWISGVGLFVAVASAAAIVLGGAVGVPAIEIDADYFSIVFKMGLVAVPLAAIPLTMLAAMRGVKNPVRDFRNAVNRRTSSLDQALGTFAPIVLMPIMMGAYGTLKQLMPLVEPFTWDDRIADVGWLLMLGHRPFEVTHALFGPQATEILDLIYLAWLPLLYFAVLFFAIIAPAYLRARFFVTFIASWLILGVLGAYLLPSAGPCFAALVGARNAHDFSALMADLQAMNKGGDVVGALQWQQTLWYANLHHRYGFGLGISAMPSMHNAIAFLYVLAAGGARPWVRVGTWLFAVAILVGSVHLGWHYLADGLVAWAGVGGLWFLAARYLRWCGYVQVEQPAMREADTPAQLGRSQPKTATP